MVINLGCGYRKMAGVINIDNRPEVNPDLVCDCRNLPYPDNSAEEVYAFDFLEHIPIGETVGQVEEIWRVLKPGGIFYHQTPSTDGRGAFQDPTHVSFWNINSWLYYQDDAYRNLYGIKAKFDGQNIDVWSAGKVCHTHGAMQAVKGESA
jgi:predicted SAM-dependent methyltransferase